MRSQLECCIHSLTEERHVTVGASPEEGCEVFKRTGAPSLRRQAEKAGTALSGKEKAPRRSCITFQYLKGAGRELERGFSQGGVVIEQGGMALS